MENRIDNVDEKVLAVKINRTYREGMSAGELYDCTRGIWKVNKAKLKNVHFAFALYHGVVKEVYEIENWFDELTTEYKYRKPEPTGQRSEFVGKVADDTIREKYIGKFLPTGSNTIQYFNC